MSDESLTRLIPADSEEAKAGASQETRPAEPNVLETVLSHIHAMPIRLELGLDLVQLVDPACRDSGTHATAHGDLMARVDALRKDIGLETGFLLPGVQVADNLTLSPDAYALSVRGMPVARGHLSMGQKLAVENFLTDSTDELVGLDAVEPAFGRRACWVGEVEAERALEMRYELYEPTQVLMMHLEEVIRRHAYEMIHLEEVKIMLDYLARSSPNLVREVVPTRIDLPTYHWLMRQLLRERVSIRDQATILETIAHVVRPVATPLAGPSPVSLRVEFDASSPFLREQLQSAHRAIAPQGAALDRDWLLEQVRVGMARGLCVSFASEMGVLEALVFDRETELSLIDLVEELAPGQPLTLPSSMQEQLAKRLLGTSERMGVNLLVVDARLRPHMKRLTARNVSRLSVLSYAEVHPDFRLQPVDTIALSDA